MGKLFFSLKDQDPKQLLNLLESTCNKKSSATIFSGPVASMFFENSTRTRLSFERAAQVVGRKHINVDLEMSSLKKGESFAETLEVFEDYGIETVVIRSKEPLISKNEIPPNVNVISAGLGMDFHPTQALGDAVALMKFWSLSKASELAGKRLLIAGDIRHSRVAHSWYELASILDVKLSFAAPSNWRPQTWGTDLKCYDSLQEALANTDAFMALRVQRERHSPSDQDENFESFQCKPGMLMQIPLLHPGPTNWGVELAPELKTYKHSLIRSQRVECFNLRTELLRRF